MSRGEMALAAELIADVALERRPPQKVRADVEDLAADYQTVHYCFEEGTEAFEYFAF